MVYEPAFQNQHLSTIESTHYARFIVSDHTGGFNSVTYEKLGFLLAMSIADWAQRAVKLTLRHISLKDERETAALLGYESRGQKRSHD